METQIKKQWGIRSASYWITLILALGIIFIGIRFILYPQVGAIGYGIRFQDVADTAYGKVKGIRDVFSGLVMLVLLIARMRKATALAFTMSIVVPLGDFLVVLSANGAGDMEHLLIHGITALIMAVNSFLLFNHPK